MMSSPHTWHHHLDHITLCLGTSFDLQVPCFIPKKIAVEPEKMCRSFSDFFFLLPGFQQRFASLSLSLSFSSDNWTLVPVPETCCGRWGLATNLCLSSLHREPFCRQEWQRSGSFFLRSLFCICKVVVSNKIPFVLLSFAKCEWFQNSIMDSTYFLVQMGGVFFFSFYYSPNPLHL